MIYVENVVSYVKTTACTRIDVTTNAVLAVLEDGDSEQHDPRIDWIAGAQRGIPCS